eukprot:325969-Alexandrium_andersonii.AAC.1
MAGGCVDTLARWHWFLRLVLRCAVGCCCCCCWEQARILPTRLCGRGAPFWAPDPPEADIFRGWHPARAKRAARGPYEAHALSLIHI